MQPLSGPEDDDPFYAGQRPSSGHPLQTGQTRQSSEHRSLNLLFCVFYRDSAVAHSHNYKLFQRKGFGMLGGRGRLSPLGLGGGGW